MGTIIYRFRFLQTWSAKIKIWLEKIFIASSYFKSECEVPKTKLILLPGKNTRNCGIKWKTTSDTWQDYIGGISTSISIILGIKYTSVQNVTLYFAPLLDRQTVLMEKVYKSKLVHSTEVAASSLPNELTQTYVT